MDSARSSESSVTSWNIQWIADLVASAETGPTLICLKLELLVRLIILFLRGLATLAFLLTDDSCILRDGLVRTSSAEGVVNL